MTTPRSSSTVIGVGLDLVELTEIEALLRRPRMLPRVFTARELAYCRGPSALARFAVRFAAKEATFKAIGTGWARGVRWLEAEVVQRRGRGPALVATGQVEKRARALGGEGFLLSLTHTDRTAAAVVLLVGR